MSDASEHEHDREAPPPVATPYAVYPRGAGPGGADGPGGPTRGRGLAGASLALGVLGLLLALVPGVGLLASVAAVVLGTLALRAAPPGRGLSVAGVVTGATGTAVGLLVLLGVVALLSGSRTVPGELAPAPTPSATATTDGGPLYYA